MSFTIGISNSEVNAFNGCQTSWLKGYHPESLLAKKGGGPARTRGIIIHKCLETWYGMIQAERPIKEATEAAMQILLDEQVAALQMCDVDKMQMVNRVIKMMAEYFKVYSVDAENWEVLSLENFHAMEADPGDDFYVPVRLDMVIYQRKGQFAGEISPVDHKSTNDWWSNRMFTLNSQMPLYIRAVRQNGFRGHPKPVVRRAIMNFIRTRDIKDPTQYDLFKREFIVPNETQIENVYRNHLMIARRIAKLKVMPYNEALQEVSMNMATTSCKYCDFAPICELEIEGSNPNSIIAVDYEKNTYGYLPLETLDGGV